MHLAIEVIKTLIARLIRIRIPPVGDGDLCIAGRYGEDLPDAIIATWITTQVCCQGGNPLSNPPFWINGGGGVGDGEGDGVGEGVLVGDGEGDGDGEGVLVGEGVGVGVPPPLSKARSWAILLMSGDPMPLPMS